MNNAVVSHAMLQELNDDLLAAPALFKTLPVPKHCMDLNKVLAGKTNETPEEVNKLKEALSVISSDVGRGNGSIDFDADPPGDYWLGVVWAIRGLGWDRGKDYARDWSKPSNKYTDDGFEKSWAAYDTSHSNPIGIGSVYKLADKFRPEVKPTEVKTNEVKQAEVKDEKKPNQFPSPLSLLNKFSVTGSSKQMRKRMLGDVYVMQDIAILGQSTVIYAAPNVGKTLLVLWLLREQIESGVISPDKIFYVNADDTFKGGVEKTELAELWGMQLLIPNENDFKVSHIPTLMDASASSGEASGVVLVLDTLKKIVDLMSKQGSSAFGNIARRFVSAGGTLICLAHTNKHKDADGKSIYSGTSDIVDDSDCAYIIDKVSDEGDGLFRVHTIQFSNIKMRGDVASTAGFSFTKKKGQDYQALLNSVKRIGSGEVESVRKSAGRNKQFQQDREVTESILNCIRNGTSTKSTVVKAVADETGEGTRRVKDVLNRWTGTSYEEGHRWTLRRTSHNAHQYSVLPDPTH